MAVTPISPEDLQALLSKSRSKGQYDDELAKFWDSGEAGVQVDLTQGAFQGKKPQTIKTGFENASKRESAPEGAAKSLQVIVSDENVYLIRRDMA